MLIYKITNSVNGKIYVGQTNNLARRKKEHLCRPSSILGRAIRKYGREHFLFEVLVDGIETQEELNRQEVIWIGRLRSAERDNGYNATCGGDGTRLNQVARAALSIAKTGQKVPALSVALRGKRKSADHVANMREAFRRRPGTKLITHDGETHPSAEWARRVGISKELLHFRLRRGWPFKRAISKPVGRWL